MSEYDEQFDTFYRREFGPLIAFVLRLGYPRWIAEEAAQQAMAEAYRRWPDLYAPRAYVRKPARGAAARTYRAISELRGDVPEGPTRCEALDPTLGATPLEALLRRLPGRRRQVFVLGIEGWTTREIAEALGIREATVRSHRRCAHDELERLLTAGLPDDLDPDERLRIAAARLDDRAELPDVEGGGPGRPEDPAAPAERPEEGRDDTAR